MAVLTDVRSQHTISSLTCPELVDLAIMKQSSTIKTRFSAKEDYQYVCLGCVHYHYLCRFGETSAIR